MGRFVIHRPRLAWDGARMVVAAIERGHHGWIGDLLAGRLGPEYRRHVEDTWLRMTMEPDRALIEAGLWRALLDDLMAQQPDRPAEVANVIDEAMTFLSR
jgi:hypothetical protein